jgi:hypothetical protein
MADDPMSTSKENSFQDTENEWGTLGVRTQLLLDGDGDIMQKVRDAESKGHSRTRLSRCSDKRAWLPMLRPQPS